jgi:nucleotidyltransferase/DNA polymerase involved in DNA repair
MVDPAWSAALRRDPTLGEQRVAIVDAEGPRGIVLAQSVLAYAGGVRPRMRGHRARALVEGLRVQVEDPHARACAREALYDAAASLSPTIEPEGDRVFLDARGVRARFQSEQGFAAALARACERVGLTAAVSVATGRRTAAALARGAGEGECVVARDEDARDALAALPLEALELRPTLTDALAALGVRTVGALAKMTPEALADRLGEQAADAVRLARGEDRTPVLARPRPERFEERAAFEWELCEVEPLLFACRRLVDAALARLACRALRSREARVALSLRGGGAHERRITVGAPTVECAVWLRLLRASLEASAPPEAVVGARVEFVACAPRGSQLGLFDPAGPAPERWAVALARIEATVGADRVGAPRSPATHRPGEVGLSPFDPANAREIDAPRGAHDGRETLAGVARWTLALHVFRPARRASVRYENGAILSLSADGVRGRVTRCAGPYRRAGAWWDDPFEQDSWDVALEDQSLYRVAYDARAGAWLIEGRYE